MFVRSVFVCLLFTALLFAGCGASAISTDGDPNVLQDKDDAEVSVVKGRIVRDKNKKVFSTGWGFRGDGDEPVFYLLKKYPPEFDANAPFMNERRAKLKLRVAERSEGTLAKPHPAEILDVVDISRSLDGN